MLSLLLPTLLFPLCRLLNVPLPTTSASSQRCTSSVLLSLLAPPHIALPPPLPRLFLTAAVLSPAKVMRPRALPVPLLFHTAPPSARSPSLAPPLLLFLWSPPSPLVRLPTDITSSLRPPRCPNWSNQNARSLRGDNLASAPCEVRQTLFPSTALRLLFLAGHIQQNKQHIQNPYKNKGAHASARIKV